MERIFSRLLAISMQRPTVIGLAATKNHCTIAHITVLLVALTAHRLGYEDKILYVKSFLPSLVHEFRDVLLLVNRIKNGPHPLNMFQT